MILLETQSVIWLGKEQENFSVRGKQALVTAREQGLALAISDMDMTLWESAMAARRDRIGIGTTLSAALNEIAAAYIVLPITPENCRESDNIFDGLFLGTPRIGSSPRPRWHTAFHSLPRTA